MIDWKSKVLEAIDAEQDQPLELCSQLIRFPRRIRLEIRARSAPLSLII